MTRPGVLLGRMPQRRDIWLGKDSRDPNEGRVREVREVREVQERREREIEKRWGKTP